MHVLVVAPDRHVRKQQILDRAVFQILTKTSDRDAIPSAAEGVANGYAVATRLDGDAIVAALIGEVLQEDVAGIHGIETVGVLDPVRAVGCRKGGRIAGYGSEMHVRAVHDVEGPEGGLLDEEGGDGHGGDVPKDEGHGASGEGRSGNWYELAIELRLVEFFDNNVRLFAS